MAHNNMKVSIITVVYNAETTIEKTIRSVIKQSYTNIEFIIIDGNSTDKTYQIIYKYWDYINFYLSEPDLGIYDAMNKGIKYATGDIVAFLNSGDWYDELSIEHVINYFNNSDNDILMGSANVIQNDNVILTKRSDIRFINFAIPCCHQAVFSKKTVFDCIGGFDLKYKICADYDWLLRAYNNHAKILCIPEVLVNYSSGGVSENQRNLRIKEGEDIALYNAIKIKDNRLTDKVKAYNKKAREDCVKDNLFDYINISDIDFINNILDMNNSYYIWGTGYYGRRCFKLFEKFCIDLKGFIDNNVLNDELFGYCVMSPENVLNDGIVCIATPKYENEIIQQLKKDKIKNKYICFSEIRDKISIYVKNIKLKEQNHY
jgi:glycosyltransferase involved in cell wall biosynthesis